MAADARGGHVVLIGAMGVGKTTIGTLLAERLGREFRDSDDWIALRHGRSGASIAAEEGVEQLHEIELATFIAMTPPPPAVVAPAASVVDHGLGRRVLTSNFTVWLYADPAVLETRRRTGTHRREMSAIESAERTPNRVAQLARCSSMILETTERSPDAAVASIVMALNGS